MISIDLFIFVMVLVLVAIAAAAVGAAIWGRAVRAEALEDKTWILKNTIFKDRLMAELRGLEAEALALATEDWKRRHLSDDYWKGKLQAFRDIIVRLGGKIYD